MNKNFGKYFSDHMPVFFLSILLATAWTLFIYINNFQLRTPGMRQLALTGFSLILFLIVIYLTTQRLKRVFNKFTAGQRLAAYIFSGLFAVLLICMIPIAQDKFLYFLLPSHDLRISIADNQLDQIEVVQFNTAAGAIDPKGINPSRGYLVWKGKVGDQAVLAFTPKEKPVFVKVEWDGFSQSFDLSGSTKHNVIFVKQTFEIPWYHRLLWLLATWLALASLMFLVTVLLASFPMIDRESQGQWIWFSFPMIFVWMTFLLTYWPGLMSPDSIMQWSEVQTGQFTDAHPAIHSMFIWLLSRVWNTPAIFAIFHILLLGLLTAWGLGEIQKQKVAPVFLWAIALLFAFFPINGLLIISIWKDITYACAIFALFLQFTKIVLSNGKWLENNLNIAGFILAALTASFVRHNGLPVVLGSLFVLVVLYKNYLHKIMASIIIFIALWLGIRGMLYPLMNVKLYPGFGNILFLDHINAHIHAGTTLKPDEITFIESLLPLSDWPYNCADSDVRKMDGPIPFEYFSKSTNEPARIALNLFFRDPLVDIAHTFCANSLIWKINTGHYLYVVSLNPNEEGNYAWISPNNMGLEEQSIFPRLTTVLASFFSDKSLPSKPAFYLLMSIFTIAVASIRMKRAKLLFIFTPLFFQTSVMLLVNFAQDFRYLYSTVLISLFSLILLFIPNE